MVFGYFRQVLYISLLLTNAIAILNEERFLAKSEPIYPYLQAVPMASACGGPRSSGSGIRRTSRVSVGCRYRAGAECRQQA